jgi:hypothetical protein
MAIPLKLATASQEIFLGVFVDATDGFTAETGLTIADTDIKLGKAGATTLANKNSGGGTHISGGIYSAVLDATDTDTLGPLIIYTHVAGARPVRMEYCVYPANIYDSLIAGTDFLQIDVTQLAGSATAATRQSNLFLYGMGTTTVAAFPAPTISTFAGGLTGATYPDNCFRNGAIVFTSGQNASMVPRVVSSFTSNSGLFTMRSDLAFVPVADDTFQIVGVAA